MIADAMEAPKQFNINSDNAREMARRSLAARMETRALQDPLTRFAERQHRAELLRAERFRKSQLNNVRRQINLLNDAMLSAEDAERMVKLATALAKLLDIEATLAARPNRPSAPKPGRKSRPAQSPDFSPAVVLSGTEPAPIPPVDDVI